MNIEEIKALYAKRGEAFAALQSINHTIDIDIESEVQNLARKTVPIYAGDDHTYWYGSRLRDLVTFDSDNNEFIILIESYAGEGNWCTEYNVEEDEYECARVPARWLEMDWNDIKAEVLTNKAAKEYAEQQKKDAIAAEKNKEQEAYELAELARLSSKYKCKEIL